MHYFVRQPWATLVILVQWLPTCEFVGGAMWLQRGKLMTRDTNRGWKSHACFDVAKLVVWWTAVGEVMLASVLRSLCRLMYCGWQGWFCFGVV